MNDKRLTNGSLALNNKKVITIDAVKTLEEAKLRVAAYARVSCDKDAMKHSLAAQISYYNEYIQRNPDWVFAGIYAEM